MTTSNTITKTDLENILNEVLPSCAVDYVVEQGTSGYWTYRKWDSGIAEMWFNGSTTVAIATTAGSLYTSNTDTKLNYPFTLNSVHYASITAHSISYAIWAWKSAESTASMSCRLFSIASRSSANYPVTAYVKGTWK